MENLKDIKIDIIKDLIWFVCSVDASPVGMVALDIEKEEIRCLLVDSECRRKGIGRKLIKAVEEYAKDNNIKRVFSTSLIGNELSKKLFENIGYVELVKMEKIL